MREKAVHIWTNIQKRKGFHFFIMWLLFFGLAILFRLPHLLSKASFFDGDEAIVGIMASDLLAGRTFPIYFYGQSYGLAMFEVWSSAFWIALLGKGVWALRLAGLTLFALGTTFLFKGLVHRGRGKWFAFIVAIGILSFPTWIMWGMLVRGGYVTSFLAVCLLFYFLSKERISFTIAIFLGLLLAVSFEAHSLLLIPVLPLLLRDWISKKFAWSKLAVGAVGAVAFIGLFRILDWNKIVWNRPTLFFEAKNFPGKWNELKENLLNIYGDFYSYSMNFEIPEWWKVLLTISLVILGAIVLTIFIRSDKKNKLFWLLWLGASVVVVLLSFTLFGYNPRYYVSLFTAVFFLFIFYSKEVSDSKLLKWMGIVSVCIFLAGLGSGSKIKREYYDTNVHCMNSMETWHDSVVNEKLKAVYLNESLLQWQWNYMYGDEIPAAPFWIEERTNRFIDAVQQISDEDLSHVGMIGYWGHFNGLDSLEGYNDTRYHIEKKYYVQPIMTTTFRDAGFAHGTP